MNKIALSSAFIFSSIVLISLAIYGLKRKKAPGALAFSMLLIAMSLQSFGYAFELLSTTMENMKFWLKFQHLGIAFYPLLIIKFSSEFADEKRFVNKYVQWHLFVMGIVTFLLVATNSYHSLYFSSITLDSTYGFDVLVLHQAAWQNIQLVLLATANIYSLTVFVIKAIKSKGHHRQRFLIMIAGVCIPLITLIAYILDLGPRNIDMFPFAYMIMCILIRSGLFKYNILYLTPVSHEMVFDAVDEAVIVTDKNDILISFNNSSKKFFPSLKNMSIGESIREVEDLKDYDFKLAINRYEKNGNIYSLKLIEIEGTKGKIYVLSNITESENAKRQLEFIAKTDKLTGVNNRWVFMEKLEKARTEGVFIILDIDNFKEINDNHGHVEGDKVLSYFGEKLKSSFEDHVVCRYGGEEFAIFIDNNDFDRAYEKIEDFRKKIISNDDTLGFTFSAGMSRYEVGFATSAIIEADKKLYEAKASGRNQIKY